MKVKQLWLALLSAVIMFTTTSVTVSAQDAITAIAPNGSSIVVTAVNKPVAAVNDMILFTRENSSPKTDSNEWSTAAIVDYSAGKYIVKTIADKQGAVDIPSNGFVLFGNWDSGKWVLNNLKVGDEVVITGYTLPAPVSGPVLMLEDGSRLPVNMIDQDRTPGSTVIYTYQYGEKTKPFDADTLEYIVSNGVIVIKNTNGQKGTYIPASGYVLSVSAAGPLGALEIGHGLTTFNLDIKTLPARYMQVAGVSVAIDKLNGGRGLAEVILYQPSYGSSTRANPWGMEITVDGDRVTRVVAIAADASGNFIDNNSPIPANGYVLSIQSASPYYKLLNGKVAVGNPVKLVLNSLIFKAVKTPYDELNAESRDLNEMVIYDRSIGERTGTNPWGNEVVVDSRGLVISNGGNNNKIPEGGYVISGVGSTAAWLVNNVLIGSTVRVDHAKKMIYVIFTPSSYLDKANIGIEQVERGMQVSRDRFLDVPYSQMEEKIASAKAVLEQAKVKLENIEYDGLFDILNQLDQLVNDAVFMNFESRKVETRALWLRPKETNIEQVKQHLSKIKATNINSILLETWWDGYTIYPTKLPDTSMNPMYKGFDVLKAYTEEGKKLGIEIHAWVENFYVGQNHMGQVLVNHPEWTMMTKKGQTYSGDESFKNYFINPALPEARDFVISIYKELVTKYEVAGLHLDFIRYPDSGDYTNDSSYDPYTRNLFKNKYGVDPLDIKPGDVLWDEWTRFRIDFINTFVDRIAQEVMPLRPDMKLTAAVWPNFEDAPKFVLQETKNWVDKNYMDNIFHMSYVLDAAALLPDAQNALNLMQNKGFVTSGIATNMNLTKSVLADQINQVNGIGVSGTALFEFESLFDNGYDHELKLGLYRNEAIMPDFVTTKPVYTMLEEIVRKTNEIYIPLGGLNQRDADEIIPEIQKEAEKLKGHQDFNNGKVTSLKVHLAKVTAALSNSNSIHPEVKNRVMADLNAIGKILDIYLERNTKR